MSKFWTSRPVNIGHQDVKYFDISLGLVGLFPEGSFDVDGVEIRAALPPSLHGDQTDTAQFLDVRVDALTGGAHICGQAILAGKALVQFAGVLEQHGIDEFGADGNLVGFEDEVGHACPATLRGNVRPLETEVAIFESGGFPQALHRFTFGRSNSML